MSYTDVVVTKKRSGGRATPKGSPPAERVESQRTRSAKSNPRRLDKGGRELATSSRYTAPPPKVRFRPRWHRFFGWSGVALGVLIIALNDVMLMGNSLTLLPFGHSELYLMLGMGVGASSAWFLGLYDHDPTIYR